MHLRNILSRFLSSRDDALASALTVEARPGSLVHKDFREFTAPARRQRGSSLSVGRPGADRLSRIGIVPVVGGNVP